MRAKINTLIILITVFAASLIAALLAGCIGEKDAKERADSFGMTACVTYYTNGGSFVIGSKKMGTPDQKVYRTDYYYPGTPIFNIGEEETGKNEADYVYDKTVGQPIIITRSGYVFAGWKYAKLDEETKLPLLYTTDEEGNKTYLPVLESGTASMIGSTGREMLEQEKRFEAEIDEERGLVFANGHPTVGAGEHVYLVATWELDVFLEYRIVTDADVTTQIEVDEIADDGGQYTEINGKIYKTVTYKTDDTILTESFETYTSLTLYPDTAPVTFSGFSYINLYRDIECNDPVKTGEVIEKKDGENSVIYVKYLSGSWTPVKTANDAVRMFTASGNSNFYVVYDDIDCSKTEIRTLNKGYFGGVIDGNGKTIKNVNVTYNANNGDNASLFGNLNSSAQITDLTIENVTINVTVRPNAKLSLHILVSSLADGAKIENVILNNVTVNITKPSSATISNIEVDDVYKTDNWLYGVYPTDEQFESSKYGDSVKVKNATLTMTVDGKEVLNINVNKEITNQEDSNE